MRTLPEKKPAENPLWISPFPFMRRLTEEMDRAFGLDPLLGVAGAPKPTWAPPIEVFERDHMFVVRAELPGLAKEDVKVTLTHEALTIEGERKVEKEEKTENFYRTERSYGGFRRCIALPDHVKAEAAKATFKNGVLEIEMPAIPIPEAKTRTLEIQG